MEHATLTKQTLLFQSVATVNSVTIFLLIQVSYSLFLRALSSRKVRKYLNKALNMYNVISNNQGKVQKETLVVSFWSDLGQQLISHSKNVIRFCLEWYLCYLCTKYLKSITFHFKLMWKAILYKSYLSNESLKLVQLWQNIVSILKLKHWKWNIYRPFNIQWTWFTDLYVLSISVKLYNWWNRALNTLIMIIKMSR